MTNDQIYSQVSKELGYPKCVVEAVHKFFYKFIREKLASYDLKKDFTREEFKEMRLGFNVPSIGKFYVDYDKHYRHRMKYKFVQEELLRKQQEMEEKEKVESIPEDEFMAEDEQFDDYSV